MNPLRELAMVSDYRPTKGAKLVLFNIIKKEGITKESIQVEFDKTSYKGQLRTVYKRLKDDLLKELSEEKLNNIPKSQSVKFEIWRKHLKTKILIGNNKKSIGIKLAKELLNQAYFYEEFEVALSICKELVQHYSIVTPNTLLYKKYSDKLRDVNRSVFLENEVELLYRQLIFHHQKKWSFKHLEKEIEDLINLPPKADYYKYRYQYYSLKALYYQLKTSADLVLENAKEALLFFDNCKESTSYLPKYKFLTDMIPIAINKGDFSQAKNSINTCLNLEPKGTNNWHFTLSDKAILGFYFNKFSITEDALKESLSDRKNITNITTKKRWDSIIVYLYFIKYSRGFNTDFELNYIPTKDDSNIIKIQKYLNDIGDKKIDVPHKINILILEILLHLCQGNKSKIMDRLEGIEQFIHNNLRKHIYTRPKHFMRLLKCIEKGDYKKMRVAAHGKKHLAALRSTKPVQTSLRFDYELCPYEMLWEGVLKVLK